VNALRRLRRWLWPTADDIVREFVARFPGRCPICSFDRYSKSHGGPIFEPTDHACPERP
jgi:hypothetical protein